MKSSPPPNIKLYSNVKAARKLLCCSQTVLALRVGVFRSTLIRIEKGEIIPSVLIALRLAKFLDTPVDELFTFEETRLLSKDEKFDLYLNNMLEKFSKQV